MKQLADGVWQLSGFPADNVNKYLVGDVLIDAGLHFEGKRIIGDLEGREVRAHALTHAHLDHYGSSHTVCERLGLPLWCGADDAEAVEAGGSTLRDHAQVDGSLGYFQHSFKVYDREGEACVTPACTGTVTRLVQSGRSTFYCPVCQKRSRA